MELIKHKIKIEFPKIKLPLLEGNLTEEPVREKHRMSDQISNKVMTERFANYRVEEKKGTRFKLNKDDLSHSNN